METTQSQDNMGIVGRWLMDFSVAMLTTVDANNGILRSRPMALAGGEFLGDLYFYTREATTKVDEIQKDQQVNVALADPASGRYLSLSGNAKLIREPSVLREHWNESMLVWFPDGLQQHGLVVLCVSVQSAEYWDRKNRMIPEFIHLV